MPSYFPHTTNKEMAAVLFNIATLLREQGNVNPYRTAAYERGARSLMALDKQATQVLKAEGEVPFARRWRIGAGLQAKIREMAQTGALKQFADLASEVAPDRAGLMAVPGIGPRMAMDVQKTLGIGTAEELIRAARNGSLRCVHGFGPKRVAFIANLVLPVADQPADGLATSAQVRLFNLFDLTQTD